MLGGAHIVAVAVALAPPCLEHLIFSAIVCAASSFAAQWSVGLPRCARAYKVVFVAQLLVSCQPGTDIPVAYVVAMTFAVS